MVARSATPFKSTRPALSMQLAGDYQNKPPFCLLVFTLQLILKFIHFRRFLSFFLCCSSLNRRVLSYLTFLSPISFFPPLTVSLSHRDTRKFMLAQVALYKQQMLDLERRDRDIATATIINLQLPSVLLHHGNQPRTSPTIETACSQATTYCNSESPSAHACF